MEKIVFTPESAEEPVEFYVLEETRLNGTDYILVTDAEEDGEALILKDMSADGDSEAIYEIVDDDMELGSVMSVFEELLDDVDLVL